jgi:hypothetical protein
MIPPYVKEPEKRRRILLILNDYKKVTSRNGKYNTKMLQNKLTFEEDFFINLSRKVSPLYIKNGL